MLAERAKSGRSRPVVKGKGIPSLVRALRRRLELTQEQFAQEVGVTYSTVNHWENGEPGYAVLRATNPQLFQCPFLFASDVGTAGFRGDDPFADAEDHA